MENEPDIVGKYDIMNDKHVIITADEIKDITNIVVNKDINIIVGDTIILKDNVITVLETTKEPICGTLHISSHTSYGGSNSSVRKKFTPFNKLLPTFLVNTKKPSQSYDIYAVIKFEKWEGNTPIGSILSYIGTCGDSLEIENMLLTEYTKSQWKNIKKDFDVTKYLTDLHQNERVDLSHELIVSIDPPNCKDIDDALHFKKKPNSDNFEIGVHIADVTSFIDINSDLDREIRNRCETLYLKSGTYNMIPDALSIEHISLIENKKNRAFSVLVTVDSYSATVISVRFCKSTIVVKNNYSYEVAQTKIDKYNENSGKKSKLLKLMYDFGKKLLINKFGSCPHDYDTHKMVEVYMILANSLVGTFINSKLRETHNILLRKHVGETKIMDYINSDENSKVDKTLKYQAKLCHTSRATYCISNKDSTNSVEHKGLSENVYTHFTSPIRRYADIVIHRLLYDAMHNSNTFAKMVNCCLVTNLNKTHKKYDECERHSMLLDTIFKLPTDVIETFGHVVNLGDTGSVNIYVNVFKHVYLNLSINLFANKLAHLVKITNLTPQQITLESVETGKNITLKLFQKLGIKIIITKRDRQKIRLKITDPDISVLVNNTYYDILEAC